jgi:hypothetical protein
MALSGSSGIVDLLGAGEQTRTNIEASTDSFVDTNSMMSFSNSVRTVSQIALDMTTSANKFAKEGAQKTFA